MGTRAAAGLADTQSVWRGRESYAYFPAGSDERQPGLSGGGAVGHWHPPREAGEERQRVKTGGAGPTRLRAGDPHLWRQLPQLFPLRPSLSVSVSTTPASALLCDRLTLPARRGGSPAQEDPTVSLCPWQGPPGIVSREMQVAHTGPCAQLSPGRLLHFSSGSDPQAPHTSLGDKGASNVWMATPDPLWEAESEVSIILNYLP